MDSSLVLWCLNAELLPRMFPVCLYIPWPVLYLLPLSYMPLLSVFISSTPFSCVFLSVHACSSTPAGRWPERSLFSSASKGVPGQRFFWMNVFLQPFERRLLVCRIFFIHSEKIILPSRHNWFYIFLYFPCLLFFLIWTKQLFIIPVSHDTQKTVHILLFTSV